MDNFVLAVKDYDGDFGATMFNERYSPIEVARRFYWEGIEREWIVVDDGYEVEVTLYRFGRIDAGFVKLIKDEFMEYDRSKADNFYVFNEKEVINNGEALQ